MIYNTRNRSNNTTVSQNEKKTCFNAYFQYSQSKIADKKVVHFWNKIWPLKYLVKLKCERRASLHAVQYKWQTGFVLMFCSYCFENG